MGSKGGGGVAEVQMEGNVNVKKWREAQHTCQTHMNETVNRLYIKVLDAALLTRHCVARWLCAL